MSFIRNRRRARVVAVAGLLVLAPLVASCGFDVQTEKVYQPAPGVNVDGSTIDVLGALVVSDTPGSGIFIATFNNDSESHSDEVVSVEANGAGAPVSVNQRVPAGGILNLADSKPKGVALSQKDIAAGGYIKVQITFRHGAPMVINVPVVPNDSPYNDILPSTSPSATATPEG